jgi:putative resolvase
MLSNYVSIHVAAEIIGVTPKTLRRWDKSNQLEPDFRTYGGHRRYNRSKIIDQFKSLATPVKENAESTKKRAVSYSRVSSSKQNERGDLERQQQVIVQHCVEHNYAVVESFSDVGSGLNDKRRGLLRMLQFVSNRRCDIVVVNYSDRLSRFGLQIIKQYVTSWGVELQVIHPTIIDSSPHAELITDLTVILYSFMGKLYRMRRTSGSKPKPV